MREKAPMNGKEESPGYIETILNELQGKTPLNLAASQRQKWG